LAIVFWKKAARSKAMNQMRDISAPASHPLLCGAICLAAAIFSATVQARAQQPQSPPQARVIVIGEGSIAVPPDYAQIGGGVTTSAKTAKEATDANSKLMAAITAALLSAGVEQKDILTLQFSVRPVYVQPQPNSAPKLSGFNVSNQVRVTIRQIAKLGDILDRLVTAGATDIGNIEFLRSDPAKALDQARQAAIADARGKAELYALASGLSLGPVAWITEDSAYAPPMPTGGMRASVAAVPIAGGEDTLQVRVTVGFDIAH
jgi:uncharacterized protein YggE